MDTPLKSSAVGSVFLGVWAGKRKTRDMEVGTPREGVGLSQS